MPFEAMTSFQRVLTALSLKEADRVPLMLPLTTQGAEEMGVPLKDYFQSPALIAEAQLRFHESYHNDYLNGSTYAVAEYEAFGGDTLFYNRPPQCRATLAAYA